jgi:Family of unknown function (DUF6878)
MTDTTETSTAAPIDDVGARNKAIVFAALAEAGIRCVTVEYDGSGDSGQIENVEAWNAGNERIPFPSPFIVRLISEDPDRLPSPTSLEGSVENLAWDYLEERHDGWENNDGGFGTFVFDVPSRTITLEHNERYTEYSTSSDEF